MSSPVVKRVYKQALLSNYFADVPSVIDRSTVALFGALATGLVTSVQIHYGSKASQAYERIREQLTCLEEEMPTKKDLKNLVHDITKQNPCLKNAKSIFPRYPK